jgi:RHS repeat-associated protein
MNIRANAYYRLNGASAGTPSNPASELLAALAGSIQGVTGGKFGMQQVQSSGVLGPGISDLLQRQTDQSTGSTRPKAFLNWVLLDEQFKIVNTSTGFEPVGSDGEFKSFVKTGLPISQNGYLYVYTSNESPVDVFFDNLQVTHVRGPLLEETHYYPFGLTMAGISSKAAGKLENRYKYNGIEFDEDLGLNTYEAFYRTLDPTIARWWQIDPKVEEGQETISPYVSMGNNPVKFGDPLGDLFDITIQGAQNSSVTIKTDLINVKVDVGFLGINFGGNHSISGESVLQAGLDLAGIADPTGIADGINAGLSLKNGDWLGAGISALGIIPFGDLAKVGKVEKDVKVIKDAVDEVKSAKQLLKEGRAGKQERLLEIAEDTKASSADRGWIKQEKNAVDAGKRTTMRNPPGKDLAHSRGKEAAKGYSYKHSKLQDRDLHRRQHKYDNNGKSNKENPN